MEHLSFLFILLIYLVIPIVLAFQKKVRFVFRLRYLLPAILFSAAIFLMIHWRFTQSEIWTYNYEYITGIHLLKIPLEVWLSVFIIPVSSAYIYEWLKVKFENFEKDNVFLAISLFLLVAFVALAYFYRNAMFSFFIFFLTAIYLGYTIFRKRFKQHLTKFYLAYLVSLVPFTLDSFIMSRLGLITFNPAHTMKIALLGVPAERFIYLYLMLLINFTIYESLSESNYF